MQRRTDGWHLELVVFGAGGARTDELVGKMPSLKELRPVPLKREGWERRDFGVSLEGGHESLPIHVTILAYGGGKHEDFVPELANADGVLLVESGKEALDAHAQRTIDARLAERIGSPPSIVERAAPKAVKEHLKTLMKRTIQALRAGQLFDFWKKSAERAEAAHDEAVFGPLTRDKILAQPEGELVAFLLHVTHERGRRAVASGRLPTAEAFERSLSSRWQRFFAVNALEALVADAGIDALFGVPGDRAMEPEEVAAALSGLRRIGAAKKAAIVERALVVAREAKLWEGKPDEVAAKVLEELSDRFYAIDDEPLRVRLEADVRRAPEEYTLSAYED